MNLIFIPFPYCNSDLNPNNRDCKIQTLIKGVTVGYTIATDGPNGEYAGAFVGARRSGDYVETYVVEDEGEAYLFPTMQAAVNVAAMLRDDHPDRTFDVFPSRR